MLTRTYSTGRQLFPDKRADGNRLEGELHRAAVQSDLGYGLLLIYAGSGHDGLSAFGDREFHV